MPEAGGHVHRIVGDGVGQHDVAGPPERVQQVVPRLHRTRGRRAVASPAVAASLTENGSQAGFVNELMGDVPIERW